MSSIFMPTKVLIDDAVIENNQSAWLLGQSALLITGRSSAKLSGAEADVIACLEANNIQYSIFNQVENDPTVETVLAAAEYARAVGADFIIGIGGGSPLDAAKGVAVLAVNEALNLDGLFRNQFTKALPIVAIPTTAGTGSEVTPYSVLYRQDIGTKVSFGSPLTFPKVALLDEKYTKSLRKDIAIHTAIDAFTHSFEGFLANRASAYSDTLALDAVKRFGRVIDQLADSNYSSALRKELLYISMLGGMVISHTGVTVVHAMGYAYTVHYDIPHGQANGFLLGTYLKYLKQINEQKLEIALDALGLSAEQLIEKIKGLIGSAPAIREEEIAQFTEQTLVQSGSLANTSGVVDEAILKELWKNEWRQSHELV
ncbi:MAG: iron-containing alcohol dehydrogenase family protein [Streptococcaceae bacterium]|jgi:alcohol dehydrogenase class IV|nr:iron-containing alcohol dehydrogenase family protein [Streptococcaceae bacterium]